MIAVRANEPIAPLIEAKPMLAAAGRGRHLERFRIERKIASTQFERHKVGQSSRDCLIRIRPGGLQFISRYRTPSTTRRPMNPIVQPPLKTVEQPLHIPTAKARERDAPLIRNAVTIRIFAEQNVRRVPMNTPPS